MQKGVFSRAEQEAIASLGGFDAVSARADRILCAHGFLRGFFTRRERRLILQQRRGPMRAIEISFSPSKSVRAHIEDLLKQAKELQAEAGGTAYVGAMLQHLVGAKLDIVLGPGKVQHRGFSVADHPTARNADYEVGGVAIHVTTNPTEALVRKCASNLKAGLRPVIVTLGDSVPGAVCLLKRAKLEDRVDVLDAGQFLTANIYERSRFEAADCKGSLGSLLDRYNDIVKKVETDPGLHIRVGQ
ncbi:MAG: DUF4928 family protein [Bryobacteraceae bacterium]|nr:DUF4928 family protein [Bryobacteraceae bacterium]